MKDDKFNVNQKIIHNVIDVKMPALPKRRITKWIKNIASLYQKAVGELSFIYCTDEVILKVNREYLSHNYYTDIITFDYSKSRYISGDMFISMDTVRSNAKKFTVPFENELYRVMIHGVLHLCGVDDTTEDLRKIMVQSEDYALSLLLNTGLEHEI